MNNSSKVVKEVVTEILTQMYAAADPPLDFQDVLDNPEEFDDDWYQQHTLCEERQTEIIEEAIEPYNLDEWQRTAITMEVRLNLGPKTPE